MQVDLSNAGFSETSAFVAPGQNSTFSADIVWTRGGQLVNTLVDVSVSINGSQQFGTSENGEFNLQLIAPNETGIHPITIDLINLPAGGIDRTDVMQIVAWMVVDGNRPSVVQFLSPDPLQLVQERDWKDLEFEIMAVSYTHLTLPTKA